MADEPGHCAAKQALAGEDGKLCDITQQLRFFTQLIKADEDKFNDLSVGYGLALLLQKRAA